MNNNQIPVPLSELPEINSTDNIFVFASKENTDGTSDSGKLSVSKIRDEAEKKKGYFNSYESLIAKYPNPRKDGEVAYVGTPFPGTVYDVVSGAWNDTRAVPPEDEVPLADYTLNGGSAKSTAQLDEEIESLDEATQAAQNAIKISSDDTYILSILDSNDIVLFGIKYDGTSFMPKGIPVEVAKALRLIDISISSIQDSISPLLDTISIFNNSEYPLMIMDKTGVKLLYSKQNGTIVVPKLESPVIDELKKQLNRINNIVISKLESEYKYSITDPSGTLLFSIGHDGTTNIPKLKSPVITGMQKQIELLERGSGDTTETFIQIDEPRCAELHLFGDISGISDSVKKTLDFTLVTPSRTISGKLSAKKQGNSTLINPKFGWRLDFMNSKLEKLKLKIGTWPATDSYDCKAYYNDATKSRDIAANRIFEKLLTAQFGKQRPWQVPYNVNNSNLSQRYDTGATGHSEGFPLQLFLNGEFWGLNVLIKRKYRENFAQDKNNPMHIRLEPDEVMDWTQFLPNFWEVNGEDLGSIPPEPVLTYVSDWFNWIGTVTEANFRNEADQYLNVPFWLLYIIFNQSICNYDCVKKNVQICFWDGKKATPFFRDGDYSFGLGFGGLTLTSPSLNYVDDRMNTSRLFVLLNSVYRTEIEAMYKELRDNGVISVESYMKEFDGFYNQFGFELLQKDLATWPMTPSWRPPGTIDPIIGNGGCYTSLGQIEDFMVNRLQFIDNKYNY